LLAFRFVAATNASSTSTNEYTLRIVYLDEREFFNLVSRLREFEIRWHSTFAVY
jgi:hypothetical protein